MTIIERTIAALERHADSSDTHKQFTERFAKDPLCALEWNTEELASALIKERMLRPLIEALKPLAGATDMQATGTALDYVLELEKQLTDQLVRFPHRHSSTSQMANLLNEQRALAASQLLDSALKWVKHSLLEERTRQREELGLNHD